MELVRLLITSDSIPARTGLPEWMAEVAFRVCTTDTYASLAKKVDRSTVFSDGPAKEDEVLGPGVLVVFADMIAHVHRLIAEARMAARKIESVPRRDVPTRSDLSKSSLIECATRKHGQRLAVFMQ